MGAPKKSREQWLLENNHLPRAVRGEGGIQDALDHFGMSDPPGNAVSSASIVDRFLRHMACCGLVLKPVYTSMDWAPEDLDAAMDTRRRARTDGQQDAA